VNRAPAPRRERHDAPEPAPPAFLFDLDGTLLDSVYQHVIAWREALARLPALHDDAYAHHLSSVRPLPGAIELLATLSDHGVPWAIATSGGEASARPGLELLGLPPKTPVVTRDVVRYAKPDPDLFLTAAERIGVDISDSIVVGDSVWDLMAARRARALGLGLLSGGYGREELIYAGAFRVYEDPRDLLAHLDEVGVRRPL
jgi:HAD superfamily hydrolase (TIGR01509 family)